MVKKILSVLVAFILITITCVNVFAQSNDGNKFSSVLVLGDSISSGYGLDGYPDDKDSIRSYCNLLRDELKPDTFNNFAINGQTSSQLLEKVKNGEYNENITNSDLILISIGGNDILGKFTSSIQKMFKDVDGNYQLAISDKTSLKGIVDKIIGSQNEEEYKEICENFKSNFLEIVKLIREKNLNTKIYFQTVYNPFSGIAYLSEIDNFAQKHIDEINQTIKDNTKDENGNTFYNYIDVADFFYLRAFELTNIFKFDIHPNSTGHQMIYQMLSSDINSQETDSDQALATVETSDTLEDTTTEITKSDENMASKVATVEAATAEKDKTNSRNNEGKQILFTAIPSVVLILIVFYVFYIRLKRKTR